MGNVGFFLEINLSSLSSSLCSNCSFTVDKIPKNEGKPDGVPRLFLYFVTFFSRPRHTNGFNQIKLENILSLKNLNKKFGRIHAVNDLSFDIQKGNVYGILGPNGSGKSTTLGIILNVVNKTSGDFQWFDGKVSTHDALKRVGAIIERPNFYPYMSAVQNLKLAAGQHTPVGLKELFVGAVKLKLTKVEDLIPTAEIGAHKRKGTAGTGSGRLRLHVLMAVLQVHYKVASILGSIHLSAFGYDLAEAAL